MPISLKAFKGEIPRTAARALPNEASTAAVNCRLLSDNLEAWRDLSSIFLLGKAGPTNTIYLFDGQYWFSWAFDELMNGATEVNVARVPIAGDTTIRTVFTGTGPPQITNVAEALGGVVPPAGPDNGPYPVGSFALGVQAPDDPPVITNIPPSSADVVTTTTYLTDQTGWTVGYSGHYGSVTSISSGGIGTIPSYPYYDFLGQQNNTHTPSTWANIDGNFQTATAVKFQLNFYLSSTNGSNLSADQDTYIQIVSDGNGGNAQGAELQIKFTASGAGKMYWQDRGAGAAAINIAGTVGATQALFVGIYATNNGLNPSTNLRTYSVNVFILDATTLAVVGSALNLTATYCGDDLTFGSNGGDNNPDDGHVFFGQITMAVSQPPPAFTPTYSNYLYTTGSGLNLESSPSPASTPSVQVDNDNINIVQLPPPPGGQTNSELYLYRVATGSTGSQYEQVENGNYSDGGFPICTVGGTANALTLTDDDGAAPAQNTFYFFTATANNTGAVTANLNGTGAKPVLLPGGGAVAAGDIVSGTSYTLVYEQQVIQTASMPVANGIAVIPMTNTAGVQVGQVVTDPIGAIPPGTTVSSINANVSIKLSNGITTPINAGVLLFFANTNASYTLLTSFTMNGTTYSTPGFTFIDATPTSDLGEALPSTDYDPPPTNMIGIIALPNGVLAGFFGNTLCLSVSGQPQAWPLAYQLATDSPIVALVALGINIGILTQGKPYTAYGTDPSAFQMGVESFPQGCVSARSTSYARQFGGVYASTDGVYGYNGFGQIVNLTEALYTKREWLTLNPSTILGIVHQGLYFFWYETLAGVKMGKILDLRENGFGLSTLDFHAIAAAIDSSDDTLYLVLDSGEIAGGVTPANNQLCQWEGASTYRPGSWTSKQYQNAYETALAIERIRASNYSGLTTTLTADSTAMSTLTPLNPIEFNIEQWAAYQHQFQIAWDGTTNPDVSTIEYVETAEQLT